jgi:hypothetical protein
MQIGSFDVGKGIGKFLLGVIAVAITFVIQNPQVITKLIPEKWATLTLSGLILELLDYILHIIKKKSETTG